MDNEQMAINSTNRVIHRFIQEISAYEPGGEFYSQIIPLDTQAYAIYSNREGNCFFYVIGDGEHTYTEIRDGKGNGEAYKEYPVLTKNNLNVIVNGVEEEVKERKAADELLQAQIDDEENIRKQIDEYLQQQIDENDESISELQRNLTKEIDERKQAIEEERVARTSGDEDLTTQLAREIAERKHFDELLDEALGEEIQNREDAISNLFNQLKEDIDSHVNDKQNPHKVTKAQVGLSNVDNTSDLSKPISIATQTALDLKIDRVTETNRVYGTDSLGNQTTYDIESFGKVDDVKINGTSIVTDKVASFSLGTMAQENVENYYTREISDTLYAGIDYETTIDNHISDTSNPHNVTKEQIGLGNVDNTSDLDKPVSNATQTALNEISRLLSDEEIRATTKENELKSVIESEVLRATQAEGSLSDAKLDKISDINKVYGTNSTGDQTSYDVDSFGKVDDVKVGNTSVVENKVATLGTMAGENVIDYSTKAVADTLYAEKSIEAVLSTEISNRETADVNLQNAIDSEKDRALAQEGLLNDKITNEVQDRENADTNLQSQIDAITASSDVTDVVGTYAQLQSYDTSSLAPNSIIKVLKDESRDDGTTYYRWVIENEVGSWSLVGEEGPYYTKSEANTTFVPQTRTINGKALSANVTLSAGDVGADSSGSAMIAEQNAKTYADTLANNYATADQGQLADTAVQPDDLATVAISGDYNDLVNKPVNISEFTNDANYVTESQLEAKQDILVSGTNLKTINNQSLLGSGNIEIESGSTTAEEIVNVNEAPGAISPLKVWQGSEQEYNQYEMTSWKNWKTDTNVSKSGETTLPYVVIPMVQKIGNKFVFSQHSGNAIQVRYSDDGINWNSSTVLSNTTQGFSQLAYNNNIYYCFLATDSSTIHRYSSSDLTSWADDGVVSGLVNGCAGMVYIQNTLWGYTGSNTCYYSSDDGMTWQTTSLQGSLEGSITSVNGIGFCGNNGQNDMPYVTTDGVNWNQATYSGTTFGGSTCVAYGNGIYVMVTKRYSGGYYLYTRTSTDGASWSDVTPLNINIGTLYGRGYEAITFVNGMFLITGHNLNVVYYSADGINWNSANLGITIDRPKGFFPVDNSKAILFNEQGSGSAGVSPFILVDKKECYTLDSEPTTSTVIYSEPSVESPLTVTSVGVGSITLSDGYVYNRNAGGDTDTYRNVGEVHPNYICNINNVGVKIGNTLIANNTTLDIVPTQGSTNAITSGAVYEVLGDLETILHNLNSGS